MTIDKIRCELLTGYEFEFVADQSILDEAFSFYWYEINAENPSHYLSDFYYKKYGQPYDYGKGYDVIHDRYSLKNVLEYLLFFYSNMGYRQIDMRETHSGYIVKVHSLDSVKWLRDFVNELFDRHDVSDSGVKFYFDHGKELFKMGKEKTEIKKTLKELFFITHNQ